jgi:hypothetical protein
LGIILNKNLKIKTMQRRLFFKKTVSLVSAAYFAPQVVIGSAAQIGKKEDLKLRFAVASDGHYGQKNTDYELFFKDIVKHLNQEKKKNQLDFALFNGDLIHDDPKFLPLAKNAFDKLKMPYYTTQGNHDMVSKEVWQQTWGYPVNHDFVLGDYAFLLGTTSNEKGQYLCADVSWLSERLDFHANKKYVFIFLHITQKSWTKNAVDCPDVINAIEKHNNVAAIFHGHDHDEDSLKKISDQSPRNYFFDGHFGGSWGTPYRGYRIVEIYKDETVYTYQFNPEPLPMINSHKWKG